MSEAVQLALIVGVPATLVALGTLIVAVRTSRKADQIHTLTNSGMTEVRNDLRVANERIVGLEKALTSKDVPFPKEAPP